MPKDEMLSDLSSFLKQMVAIRWLSVMLCGVILSTEAAGKERSFLIDYRAVVRAEEVTGFDFVILKPEVNVSITDIKSRGVKPLAYVPLMEIPTDGKWTQQAKQEKVPTVAKNAAWGSTVVDITSPQWKKAVSTVVKESLERGFSGFFLDTADSLAHFVQVHPVQKEAGRAALLDLVKEIRTAAPEAELIINRGFDLLPDLKNIVNGVLIESVFQTGQLGDQFTVVKEADTQALTEIIKKLRANNWPVFVVDYVPPADAKLAAETADKIRALGAIPFVTTPELWGESLAPQRREKRRILCLYGSGRMEKEDGPKFAADSMTAERLQTTLEWMGYEVEYLDIGKQSPPERLDPRFGGIIFDSELELPYAGEPWYVDWVLANIQRGIRCLFTGEYPFQQEVQRTRLFRGLGLGGSYAQVVQPRNTSIAQLDDKVMNAEARITIHAGGLFDLRAPQGSKVDLSVQCQDEKGNSVLFDAVFTSTWGGALLDPYITFQSSADDVRSLFEPFAYLGRIFPEGRFPAPDPSTRQGRRIFYSQIDGDGFAGRTFYAGQALCGEIIRDRILKKFPLPITASIIEAEIAGLTEEREEDEASRFQEVARSVFALPNVEAGSHAFSHPYFWIDDDLEYIPQYESRWVPLREEVGYKKIDPVRETAGSARYVTSLCPPGKKCEVMLWSGNCRPSPAALKACRDAGIEDMNGGMTTLSKRRPGIAAVSPRVMQWDGELQIHCAMQNEFVYTDNWSGPFFGGFAQVIDTFDRTEKPRRLKPVNVYYHFYSAIHQGSLKALERIYQWCLEQPLHPQTTKEFSESTRDSWHSEILQLGPNHWKLVSKGKIQTFRLPSPKEAPQTSFPDLEASQGVIGWCQWQDWQFIHTDGRPVVELVMTQKASNRLYLESSMAPLTLAKMEADKVAFSINDHRKDALVTFAGAAPGSSWLATVGAATTKMTASKSGHLTLTLGGLNTSVTLTPDT